MTVIKVNRMEEATVGGAKYNTFKVVATINGTGTVAVKYSMNVSSVTDVGVGQYRCNFSNSMGSTRYYVGAVNSYHNSYWWDWISSRYTGGNMSDVRTSANCNMSSYESGYVDSPSVGIMCVGDLA